MALVDHGVRSGALLGEVDDRLGSELGEDPSDEGGVGQVADERLDAKTGHLLPHPDPVLEVTNRYEAVDSHLEVVLPTSKVVDDRYVVTPMGEVQRRWPTEVPVTAQN
jgi:hypothetical protein